MTSAFSIADTYLSLEQQSFLHLHNAFSLFACETCSKEADIYIHWEQQAPQFYTVSFVHLKQEQHLLQNNSSFLLANPAWNDCHLYGQNNEDCSPLVLLSLYSYLSARRTLLCHSSLVNYNGNGILFLGPSGIGKTTQAELWNKYLGADILNGDLVFIRENADGFYGYGSPWHGSSPYCMNAKVKLKALICLEQASKNTLHQLSGFDVLHEIMDQVFLPHWYTEGMEACLATLDTVLTQLPVYHLACRPDENAVQLVKNELGL